MSQTNPTLRLVLDVTYETAGDEPITSLKDLLTRMVTHAVNRGGLTGDTDAAVHTYSVEVHEVEAQRDVAKRIAGAVFTLEEDHAEFGGDFTLDEWIVAVAANPESTAHPAAVEFLLLTQGAGLPAPR